MGARGFGPFGGITLQLDDNVNTYMDKEGIKIPKAVIVDAQQLVDRLGRESLVKRDYKSAEVTIKGIWMDSLPGVSPNKQWRDFAGALFNSALGQPLQLGDGTELRWMEGGELTDVRSGVFVGASGNQEQHAYVFKCKSLEPFARAVSPSLQSLGALTTANGARTTSFSPTYAGTAYGEPTYQFTLVTGSATVTQLSISNSSFNPAMAITIPNLSLTGGTFIVLVDASGALGTGSGSGKNSPNNEDYGLLAAASNGYGVTIQGATDPPYNGNPPLFAPATGVPAAARTQNLSVGVTATGALTSASFAVLCPDRFWPR